MGEELTKKETKIEFSQNLGEKYIFLSSQQYSLNGIVISG